jgi:nucleotide-binding universal stress UspA family protein
VTVLLVGEAGVLWHRLGPVREFLERHGVPVAPLLVTGPETDVGDIILARAAELGCDLVTMGAYGHSRLAELVLGGTTRHLLRRMRVPVLLAG